MGRILVALSALVLGWNALADSSNARRTVDLRDAAALEQLRESNPAHFDKIQRILAGLREQPERAEGDWLQTSFDARDVELSRLMFKTSLPPKQFLQFTLDDTRYRMHLTRSDVVAKVIPAK